MDVTFEDVTIYKCNAAYFNRIGRPTYKNWVTADCKNTHFNGAVNKGQITRCLGIRQSLNVTTSDYSDDGFVPQRWMASYHISLAAFENLIVGFNQSMNSTATVSGAYSVIPPTGAGRLGILGGPANPPIGGQERTACMVGTDDMYQQVPEHGWHRFTGNELLSSIFAQPSRGWPIRQAMTGEPDYTEYNQTISYTQKDDLGFWGPAGNFIVPDLPYFTYNGSVSAIKKVIHWKTTAVQWMGLQHVAINTDPTRVTEIDARRYDASFAEVGRVQLKRGSTSGTGYNKRSTCISHQGRFKVLLGTTAHPTTYATWQITLGNDLAAPLCLIALPWSGSVPVKVYNSSGYRTETTPPPVDGYTRLLTAASSLSDLDSNTTERYWQDTANNCVWVKPHPITARRDENDGFWGDAMIAKANTLMLFPA